MDIKPENILIDNLENIKLSGHGIYPSYYNDTYNCVKWFLIAFIDLILKIYNNVLMIF